MQHKLNSKQRLKNIMEHIDQEAVTLKLSSRTLLLILQLADVLR